MLADLDALVRKVDAHLARSGETPTAFGERAAGDPRLVRQLRDGREPRRATVEKILAAIADRNYRHQKQGHAA